MKQSQQKLVCQIFFQPEIYINTSTELHHNKTMVIRTFIRTILNRHFPQKTEDLFLKYQNFKKKILIL